VLARLATTALVGLVAHPVGVEVDIGRGLPAVTVVGLGDTAVLQARDRIRAAFGNAGFDWPDRRVTVSLPPSDLPKHGPGFDLPIAVGLLAAAGSVPAAALDGLWAIGELGLGGDVRGVRGVLAAALAARGAGARLLVVPQSNLAEAALVPGLSVAGATSLTQIGQWLTGDAELGRPKPGHASSPPPPSFEDLADVHGQAPARRALEIAAAGIGGYGYWNLLNRSNQNSHSIRSSDCRLLPCLQVLHLPPTLVTKPRDLPQGRPRRTYL
jgi:magnesium chelatase family protein